MAQRTVAPSSSNETRFELTHFRWLALRALGLGTLILTALLRGTPEDIGWYLAHVLPGVAVVLFCTIRIGRLTATSALLGYAILLPVLTLLSGFGLFAPWHDGVRIQLFTDNPNLLGADLVAVTLAAMVVRPKLPWAVWLPVVALAVVFTGSRTALLALATATAVWLVLPTIGTRNRVAALAGTGLLIALLGFAQWQVREEASLPNMLRVATTFADDSWAPYGDAQVEVTTKAAEGPYPGTRADRIRVTTNEHALSIYQDVGRSVDGEQYVASVYLRADQPQEVVLSNHLSRTTCSVTTNWQRCATPVGIGNGRSNAQFRFEVTSRGASFDIYAFGPQYERGVEPSAYAERGNTLLAAALIARLDTWRSLGWFDDSRFTIMRAHLERLATAPWFGSGVTGREPASEGTGETDSTTAPHHAHNLVLERLAADGIVGLIAWFLIVMPLVRARFRVGSAVALPWLTGLVVLNTFDMTLLHSGSYFSCAVVLGVALNRTLSAPPPLATRREGQSAEMVGGGT